MKNNARQAEMKRALRCLYILRSNVRQSVAKSLFHDELAAFDPAIEKHRRKCEMAMEPVAAT